jgi:hypothetical protein
LQSSLLTTKKIFLVGELLWIVRMSSMSCN